MKKSILLIEDNNDIRENTTEILELAAYDVLSAVNGLDGLNKALKTPPDLILCDVQMPVMNGLELFRKLKADSTCATIPFIFVTASAEKSEIESALALGADGYICKPFEAEELLSVIKQHTETRV